MEKIDYEKMNQQISLKMKQNDNEKQRELVG